MIPSPVGCCFSFLLERHNGKPVSFLEELDVPPVEDDRSRNKSTVTELNGEDYKGGFNGWIL